MKGSEKMNGARHGGTARTSSHKKSRPRLHVRVPSARQRVRSPRHAAQAAASPGRHSSRAASASPAPSAAAAGRLSSGPGRRSRSR